MFLLITMIKKALILISAVFFLTVCSGEKTQTSLLGEWVELPYGREMVVTNGPQIKFVELENDSRCATGVTCVWEGEAKVSISFKDANNTTTHTLTERGSSETKETIRGYEVLFSVNPYPKAGQVIAKEDYTLKLSVSKAGDNVEATRVPTTTVPTTPLPMPTATRYPAVRVKAPIDAVEIAIAKSLPPQYSAEVTSGLPSGCAKFDSYMVERNGDTITISVWNTLPGDPQVVCSQIYGIVHTSIQLGSDFTTGKTYAVMVNDVKKTFVAQ